MSKRERMLRLPEARQNPNAYLPKQLVSLPSLLELPQKENGKQSKKHVSQLKQLVPLLRIQEYRMRMPVKRLRPLARPQKESVLRLKPVVWTQKINVSLMNKHAKAMKKLVKQPKAGVPLLNRNV